MADLAKSISLSAACKLYLTAYSVVCAGVTAYRHTYCGLFYCPLSQHACIGVTYTVTVLGVLGVRYCQHKIG
jgi:hypothetical protein